MEKKSILIVEDELISAWALKMQLESWDFNVLPIIVDGKDVSYIAINNRPDVILMDIFLDDDVTGIDAVKEIHKSLYIPVIYITASNDPVTFKLMRETRFFDYLKKPYDYGSLKVMLYKLFSISQVNEQLSN